MTRYHVQVTIERDRTRGGPSHEARRMTFDADDAVDAVTQAADWWGPLCDRIVYVEAVREAVR